MKKYLITLLLLLATTAAKAQNDSVIIVHDTIYLPNAIHKGNDSPGLAPDTLFFKAAAQDDSLAVPRPQRVRQPYAEEEVVYQAPRRNAIRYFGSSFADHFIETPLAFGISQYEGLTDIGIGLSYTYLPEVWGGNLTAYKTLIGGYVMPGVAYRLSKPWQRVDWQAYANVGYFHTHYFFSDIFNEYSPAAAIGIRCGGSHWGRLSLVSGTVGAMTNFQQVFFTLGFNISWIVSPSLLIVM